MVKKTKKRAKLAKKTTKAKNTNYTAKDIEVLEGLEPVRKRPGMYIGGTDVHAMHHLVSEVLDNSMDEVVSGHEGESYVQDLKERSEYLKKYLNI